MFSNPVVVKILITMLTFLSMLFPNSKGLVGLRQQFENTPSRCMPIIVEAVKEKDVQTVEGYMCKNIRDNKEDLAGEIQALYDCIEGDIVEIGWKYGNAGYSESQQDGRAIMQESIDIDIKTTVDTYTIGIIWEKINNFQPEETGIRNFTIITLDPLERLYSIQATEGLERWHE